VEFTQETGEKGDREKRNKGQVMKGKTNVEESETGELRKRPSWDCRRTDWRRLEKERDALVQ